MRSVRAWVELTSMIAAVAVVGMGCVWGAKAAMAHHDGAAQPLLSHVVCHRDGGRVSVSGVVQNPNGSREFIDIRTRFRLNADRWMAGHTSQRWHLIGSEVPAGSITRCSASAWVDSED